MHSLFSLIVGLLTLPLGLLSIVFDFRERYWKKSSIARSVSGKGVLVLGALSTVFAGFYPTNCIPLLVLSAVYFFLGFYLRRTRPRLWYSEAELLQLPNEDQCLRENSRFIHGLGLGFMVGGFVAGLILLFLLTIRGTA
jgi:hypothetical protein